MKRIIRITALFLIMTLLLSGCSFEKVSKTVTTDVTEDSQVAVAFNPILYFDFDNIVAFNDINTAINTDYKNKTLTEFGNSNWCWVNISSNNTWRMRNPLFLDVWHNGKNNADTKLKAYSLTGNGSTALMCYSTKLIKLKTYNDDYIEDSGIIVSASGDKEEGLCYTASESGTLNIPATAFTALESVGGVKTGFMDSSDGSQRSAVIKIALNGKVLWCDEIGNCVGDDMAQVTNVASGELYDLPINAGDVISFSVQLNGEKVATVFDNNGSDVDIDIEEPEEQNNEEPEETEIKLLNGYDSTFQIVYPASAGVQTQKIALKLRSKLENILRAEVKVLTDDKPKAKYEILVGETNRKESEEAYSKLRGYRKNCANDYLVTVIGSKVCLTGTSHISLENATEYFSEKYLLSENSIIPTDLYYVNRPKLRNFTIGGVQASKFVIRTEKYPSILGRRAATDLADFFIVNGGINISVENDQKTTTNEILVGLTERSGISADVFRNQSLDYVKGYEDTQYNVFFEKNKLFLEAGSDYAANFATQLLIKSLTTSDNVPTNYRKSGNYTKNEYTLSDDYAYVWGDEFLTSDISGNKIQNNLEYWVDTPPSGDDAANYTNYKPDSKLVKEILKLDLTDPLRKLLSDLQTDESRGDYYSFGKMYRGGKNGGTYGVKDNMMFQVCKFDVDKGFYSSNLLTDGKMNFRYGILEVRSKLGVKQGICSSFWLSDASGAEDANEIDIFENFGSNNLYPNLHSWPAHYTQHTNHGGTGDFKQVAGTPPTGETFNDAFHYIGIEWDADFMDFYVDGQITATCEMTDPKWDLFEHKEYIHLCLHIGAAFYQFNNIKPGDNGGIEELLNFGCTQYFDYLRIFQKSTGKQRVWDYVNK